MRGGRGARGRGRATSSSNAIHAAAFMLHLEDNMKLDLRPHAAYSDAPRPARKRLPVVDQITGLPEEAIKLSLAQRLGLVEKPKGPLTSEEWDSVQKSSQCRGDSKEPCPICFECFGDEQQVLLSCSHVFHRKCIQSFERISRLKVCPMCRKENYRMKVITDGKACMMDTAAVNIQRIVRGFLARKQYFQLLLSRNPALRKTYQFGLLKLISDKALKIGESNSKKLDSFFEGLEAQKRRAFLLARTEGDWEATTKEMRARGEQDCPICMAPIDFTSTRSIALLSCSHCVHLQCLRSLENHTINALKAQNPDILMTESIVGQAVPEQQNTKPGAGKPAPKPSPGIKGRPAPAPKAPKKERPAVRAPITVEKTPQQRFDELLSAHNNQVQQMSHCDMQLHKCPICRVEYISRVL